MKAKTAALAAALSVCGLWIGVARTAPHPSEVSADWELEFTYRDLQAIRIHVPGEPAPRLFWYLQYRIVNRTGEDRLIVPDFTMYTPTGELTPAGQRVPEYVFDSLRKKLNDPFLKDVTAITGKLLQGEDNGKNGLAIWPDFDPGASSVSLFVGSLSGETAVVKLPKPVAVVEMDMMGKTREVMKDAIVLSKTLCLAYSIPGEAPARFKTPVKLVEKTWIMR